MLFVVACNVEADCISDDDEDGNAASKCDSGSDSERMFRAMMTMTHEKTGVNARWIPSKAIRCPTITSSHMYMLQSTCASKAAMDTTMQHYVFASSTLPWELAAMHS